MKNKKIIIGILTVVSTILVVCLIGFSPNLIKRLLGNVNSTELGEYVPIKTGVILDTKLSFDEKDTNIPLKIYNGSDDYITINSVIWRESCYGNQNCSNEFNIINLDTPITVEADFEYEYEFKEISNLVKDFFGSSFDIGIQYDLNGKTYNLTSFTVQIISSVKQYLNYAGFEHNNNEYEFIPNSTLNNIPRIHTGMLGLSLGMDISEKLEDTRFFYEFYGDFSGNWEFSHPQSFNSLNKKMLGNENSSNIKDYFNFNYIEETKTGHGVTTGAESIEITESGVELTGKGIAFKLYGTPKTTMEDVTIIPGFYFNIYGDDYNYSSESENIFSLEKLPQFKVTVYDKSKLEVALENAIKKLKNANEENYNINSFLKFANVSYDAFMVYMNRSVTQSKIDEVTNRINSFEIQMNPKADYTELDNVISKINNLNRSYYAEGSFNEIDTLITRYESDLSSNYQSKINNLSAKLNNAYNSLEMLDADYSRVDSAITTVNNLTTKTSDGKDLYTRESWANLQEALTSVINGKKIDEQYIVDEYAKNISNSIAALEYNPADYSELNQLIEDYNINKSYFVEETKVEFERYIRNVVYDKSITEQSVVDNWYQDLLKLTESFEVKKALGYYDSDNYEYIKKYGLMSLESYKKYIEGLEKEYYTDESVAIIEEILGEFNNQDTDIYNYTIMEQDAFNEILMALQMYVDMLEKKPGDFEELCEYYVKALSLNINYYNDITELTEALSAVDFNLKIDEQDKIDQATNALKRAINNLVLKDADYTLFNEAYNKAISLTSKHYVDFSSVEVAILEANNAKGLKIDKQKSVDDATNKLNKAISKLVLKDADYSKIDTLVAIIEDLDDSKYTNFDIIKDALNKIIYGKKANEQALVDEMYNNLKNAYDSLQKTKADYTELNKVLEQAKKYESKKDDYSNYAVLEKVLNSINYELTWDDQIIVDNYVIKINDAIDGLIKKLADYTKLQELISKIPSDYSNLDGSIQKEITQLLKEAEELSNNLSFDEQSKIDDLVIKFNELINKLSTINKVEIPNQNEGSNEKPNNTTNEIILSYLKVNEANVDIKSLPFRYTVGYDVTSASIDVGLASKTSISKVYGGKVLLPGENNVTIIVTTNDGKTYTYSLVIERSKTSDYLSELNVKQNSIDFSKTKQEYTVKVDKNTNELDLSAVAEDKNAKVTIKGNSNIKNGSKVYVEVESSDGNVRVYTLNIQKAGSVDVRVIIILIMILAILSGVIKYVQEKKKYKQENNA